MNFTNKKVVFAFSDAAGAKACLALAHILRHEGRIGSFLAFSNKDHSFYKDWDIKVDVVEDIADSAILGADFIFTGTSHPNSSGGFELDLIKLAKQKNIYTYSFVDHWVNFTLRFQKNNEFIYPDKILVLDTLAEQNAVKEGIPSNKIEIYPNPYYRYIQQFWTSKQSKSDILKMLSIAATDQKIILYAPDPLSLRHKKLPDSYDERSALADILDSINFDDNVILIITPHPLQPVDYLIEKISEYRSHNKIFFAGDNSESNNKDQVLR